MILLTCSAAPPGAANFSTALFQCEGSLFLSKPSHLARALAEELKKRAMMICLRKKILKCKRTTIGNVNLNESYRMRRCLHDQCTQGAVFMSFCIISRTDIESRKDNVVLCRRKESIDFTAMTLGSSRARRQQFLVALIQAIFGDFIV